MPSLLILSFIEWAGAFQRPQHMAIEFGRLGWDVTYVAPRFAHRLGKTDAPGVEIPSNLRVVTPWALPGGGRSRVAELTNNQLLARGIPDAPEGEWDVVIFNDARLAEAAASLNVKAAMVWDHMDDLADHVADAGQLRKAEANAAKLADRIWTGSAGLADQHADAGREARFMAGGVEGKRFANPSPKEVEAAREELSPWAGDDAKGEGPIGKLAIYFGAINERLDADLVAAVLDAGWRVLMIGPRSSRAPKLPGSKDLYLLGVRPYAALPGYLALAEVALVPYRVEGANRFLNPVKVMEYLAAGKPVLTSTLPEVVRSLGDLVYAMDNPEGWTKFLKNWDDSEETRRAKAIEGKHVALNRSWADVAQDMADDLKTLNRS